MPLDAKILRVQRFPHPSTLIAGTPTPGSKQPPKPKMAASGRTANTEVRSETDLTRRSNSPHHPSSRPSSTIERTPPSSGDGTSRQQPGSTCDPGGAGSTAAVRRFHRSPNRAIRRVPPPPRPHAGARCPPDADRRRARRFFEPHPPRHPQGPRNSSSRRPRSERRC